MKRNIIYLLLIIGLATSCDLDETPQAEATKEPVFGSTTGLEVYTASFYNILPTVSEAHKKDDMTDYSTRNSTSNFLREGAYGPQQSDGWDWERLRDLNYFIQNCSNERVTEANRMHYIGVAKFFRAYFYFEKVKRFGDVPWINKPMTIDDPDLFAARDSRTLIMDSVLADLNYAIDYIDNSKSEKDGSRSLINSWVAQGLKSRVCLFEGTFRKYHTNYGQAATANFWLKEAAQSAEKIMKSEKYSINRVGGDTHSYRNLFISSKPVATEVMLASISDEALSIYNDANWWWTSATYGVRISLTRYFVNTYLNLDGTPFTDNANYKTMTFVEEVKGRDLRLQQTIRTPGYQRVDGGKPVAAPALFSYTYTGYHPIKYCLDDVYYDSGTKNINSMPLMRYAEILLTYAEAKAELNDLSNKDWQNTIGELRARAGFTAGLTTKPTKVDPYLQKTYFPEISDPTLLEIRRERGIELVFEGLRFNDIVRWKKGNLMEMEWNGFYVPALETLMDLDGNGTPDVCFVKREVPKEERIPGVTYVDVSAKKGDVINPQVLSEDTKGEITWMNNLPRKFEDKHYLYPIPQLDIIENPNLKPQNPGW